MTAREAHKAQWEKLKDQPLKEKLRYIFTYYWPGILGGICAIVFVTSWIVGIVTQKDVALSGYLINSLGNTSYSGSVRDDFMTHRQLDSNQCIFKLTADMTYSPTEDPETSHAVLESVLVQAMTGEVDFIVTDLETCPVFSAHYMDLKNALSAQQLEKWQNRLVYIEQEALDYLTSDNFEEFAIPEYYLSIEGMKNPVALGIRLPETSLLLDAYTFPQGEVIFGIMCNAKNTENAIAFLEYIMN